MSRLSNARKLVEGRWKFESARSLIDSVRPYLVKQTATIYLILLASTTKTVLKFGNLPGRNFS